jgi:hypothetical protein
VSGDGDDAIVVGGGGVDGDHSALGPSGRGFVVEDVDPQLRTSDSAVDGDGLFRVHEPLGAQFVEFGVVDDRDGVGKCARDRHGVLLRGRCR